MRVSEADCRLRAAVLSIVASVFGLAYTQRLHIFKIIYGAVYLARCTDALK
jgi:hypothetical protein